MVVTEAIAAGSRVPEGSSTSAESSTGKVSIACRKAPTPSRKMVKSMIASITRLIAIATTP